MKQLYILFLFLVAIQLNARAQRNFKPGYVVTLNGDTTKGFIDYKEWSENPESISFKTEEEAAIQLFSVSNATAFGVNQFEDYRRYIGPISRNITETRQLINSRDTSVKKDTVFFKMITTGKYITLFMYTDYLKERLFVSEGNSTPFELKYYRYFDSRNSKITTEKTYGQQLQRLVASYRPNDIALIQKVQATAYQLKEIEKIANAINGIDYLSAKAKSSSPPTQFFIGMAANATHITYKSDNSNISSNTSVLPQLNAGINVFFNKNVRKVLLRTELSLSGSKADASVGPSSSIYGNMASQRLTFNQFTVSVSPQFIFNIYNTDEFKGFLGFGLAYTFNKYSNAKYYLDKIEVATPNFSATYMALIFKAGVTVKRFELYTGYSRPLGDFVEASVIRK
jgi:hypothetical protein